MNEPYQGSFYVPKEQYVYYVPIVSIWLSETVFECAILYIVYCILSPLLPYTYNIGYADGICTIYTVKRVHVFPSKTESILRRVRMV